MVQGVICRALLSITGCEHSDGCEELAVATAYTNALRTFETGQFKHRKFINTNRSSSTRGLEYFSCDKNSGLLLLKTKKTYKF